MVFWVTWKALVTICSHYRFQVLRGPTPTSGAVQSNQEKGQKIIDSPLTFLEITVFFCTVVAEKRTKHLSATLAIPGSLLFIQVQRIETSQTSFKYIPFFSES